MTGAGREREIGTAICRALAAAGHVVAFTVAPGGDGGALAALPGSDRFGWVTAPSSTVIQPSAVHTGMTADPRATLDHLFQTLVR